ncbi:MAG: hypothetical protein HWE25_03800 [Alphaproteobacteria bacterium]|nr:hypothetical protein [Alphaproteobacteria bacterium]
MTVEVGVIVGKVSAFDMEALDSRIRELVAFARERDGEDRTTLFRSLVDMFLTGKAPVKEPTRGQLLDVIEALIPHVDPEGRRTVAEILAGQSKPPMDLVRRLARDRAKLMEDMLVSAPFDEDDIIELIGTTGREHHQILATRSDLSANVWIALARAAPSAPPFERQSSLALWRDDLGANADTDLALEEDRVEVFVEPRRAAVGGSSSAIMSALSGEPSVKATVTRLHPEASGPTSLESDKKPASLRILKTDEDLIAERMGDRPTPPEAKMIRGREEDNPEQTHNLTTTQASISDDEDVGFETPAIEASISDTPRYLRDPGPGGWAWRSDRDGFITIVSPFAAKLFGESQSLIGTAMLDMLGLNTKLDHPVSRAFQRRSTIHDAPINLPQLSSPNQYWTLEAAPVFSASGGIFEGFEGILTPVVPAQGEDDAKAMDYDQPLFLDDERVGDPEEEEEAFSILDRPSVLQSEETRVVTKEDAPSRDIAEHKNPLADMINSTAAAMVREAVADALNPLTPKEEAERFGDGQEQPTPATSSTKAEKHNSSETIATLTLLEEALARLTAAGEKGATAQIRLQADIANACLKSLRAQLTNAD